MKTLFCSPFLLVGALSLAFACTVEKTDADKPPGKADRKMPGKADDAKGDAKGGVAQAAGKAAADAKAQQDQKADAKAALKGPHDQPPTPAAGDGKFSKGQMLRPGATPEDLLAYATAQGDPMGGKFTLEDAFAGDAELADTSKGKLHAKFKTTMGDFDCELYEDKTPLTVANFVGLARGARPSYDYGKDEWVKKKYYDGVIFHRVIKGFMLQTGDAAGPGTGTPGRPEPGKPVMPGYSIVDEFDKSLTHTGPGILSMANRGPNTGGSQFFVTVAPTPHLDNKHAIFGKCDKDIPVKISEVKVDPRRGNKPYDEVKIETIEIFRK